MANHDIIQRRQNSNAWMTCLRAIDLHEINYLFLYFSPCILEHKVAPYTCTVIILVIMASIAMGFAYYAEIKSQKKRKLGVHLWSKYIVDILTQLLCFVDFHAHYAGPQTGHISVQSEIRCSSTSFRNFSKLIHFLINQSLHFCNLNFLVEIFIIFSICWKTYISFFHVVHHDVCTTNLLQFVKQNLKKYSTYLLSDLFVQ